MPRRTLPPRRGRRMRPPRRYALASPLHARPGPDFEFQHQLGAQLVAKWGRCHGGHCEQPELRVGKQEFERTRLVVESLDYVDQSDDEVLVLVIRKRSEYLGSSTIKS